MRDHTATALPPAAVTITDLPPIPSAETERAMIWRMRRTYGVTTWFGRATCHWWALLRRPALPAA
jgi:hypothetical protein